MVNSVDPDQTAPESGSTLCLDLSVQKFMQCFRAFICRNLFRSAQKPLTISKKIFFPTEFVKSRQLKLQVMACIQNISIRGKYTSIIVDFL